MEKHCANIERNRSAMRACLEANAQQLSEPCKTAVASAGRGKGRKRDISKAEGSATE
jgi:hypothetical protein